jgi:hypothetical protein
MTSHWSGMADWGLEPEGETLNCLERVNAVIESDALEPDAAPLRRGLA